MIETGISRKLRIAADSLHIAPMETPRMIALLRDAADEADKFFERMDILVSKQAERIAELEEQLAAAPAPKVDSPALRIAHQTIAGLEAENDKLRAQLAAPVAQEPIAYAVMQDGKCLEATTSLACAKSWLPYAPRTVVPLYAAQPAPGEPQGAGK